MGREWQLDYRWRAGGSGTRGTGWEARIQVRGGRASRSARGEAADGKDILFSVPFIFRGDGKPEDQMKRESY